MYLNLKRQVYWKEENRFIFALCCLNVFKRHANVEKCLCLIQDVEYVDA